MGFSAKQNSLIPLPNKLKHWNLIGPDIRLISLDHITYMIFCNDTRSYVFYLTETIEILRHPQSMVCAIGEVVVLACSASTLGKSPILYQWFKNQQEIPGKMKALLSLII